MKTEEKAQILVDISTDAVVAALERVEEKSPGKCITKPDLFPAISRRAGAIMQESDDTVYEDEAIPPPDNKFLYRYWKDIKLLAARKHKKYIIPSTEGFRLGTLEEWCSLTATKDMPIVAGIARSASKRSRIAREHGGSSPLIEGRLKELGPGEQT